MIGVLICFFIALAIKTAVSLYAPQVEFLQEMQLWTDIAFYIVAAACMIVFTVKVVKLLTK